MLQYNAVLLLVCTMLLWLYYMYAYKSMGYSQTL